MAADDLMSMLELSKKADETPTRTISKPNTNNFTVNRGNFDSQIASLDEQVFGKYVPTQEEKPTFSAEQEMERLKKIGMNENVNITNPILMEVMNNPYNVDYNGYEDMCSTSRQIEELAKKSFTKGANMDALSKAKEVNKNLIEKDKEIMETKTIQKNASNGGNVDYSIIKMIVENVIEDKLSKFSNSLLTESKGNNTKNASVFMLGESFRVVDSEGNVYECKDMKFVGKAKMKKK